MMDRRTEEVAVRMEANEKERQIRRFHNLLDLSSKFSIYCDNDSPLDMVWLVLQGQRWKITNQKEKECLLRSLLGRMKRFS